jgi:SAM-dependent methyltransferase
MSQDTIRTAVRERYGAIARGEESGCGCGPSCCGGDTDTLASLDIGYTAEELASIPADANLGLGSGHPTAAADLQPGETVLDLGAGAGIDCFLASARVGPEGKVIGVDMTPAMVEKARENAWNGGFKNIEFRLGEIEALPVADAAVDVIVSNCVLNLSTQRQRAFEEAFRVLAPGGRLVVSDLLSGTETPKILNQFPEIVSGCLPIPQASYVAGLEAAGFTEVAIIDERAFAEDKLPVNADVLRKVEQAGGQLGELAAYTSSAKAAIIRARKA